MSGGTFSHQDEPVAFLEELDSQKRCIESYPIRIDTEYKLGRNRVHWQAMEGLFDYRLKLTCLCSSEDNAVPIVVNDRSVSNLHLVIYCVKIMSTVPLVFLRDWSTNGTFLTHASANSPPGDHRASRKLQCDNAPVLLEEGDLISVGRSFVMRFRTVDVQLTQHEHHEKEVTAKQKAEMKSFRSKYIVSNRKLGPGNHGQIYLAHETVTRKQIACKIIDLQPGSQQKFQRQRREAILMADVSQHPNVIQTHQLYESSQTIYIFVELLTAGDLYSYFERREYLTEMEIAVIIRQVLKGLQYIHERGIIHRDLKLENVLMASLTPGSRLVISDFGSAITVKSTLRSDSSPSVAGTMPYVAPEVVSLQDKLPDGSCTTDSDMFSVGVMLYYLFGGRQFPDEQAQPQDNRIYKSSLHKYLEEYGPGCLVNEIERVNPASEHAKDLMIKLLDTTPSKRPSASQALDHVWFNRSIIAKDFDALDEKCLEGWRPVPKSGSLIQRLPEASIRGNTSDVTLGNRIPRLRPLGEALFDDIDTAMAKKDEMPPPPIPIARDSSDFSQSPPESWPHSELPSPTRARCARRAAAPVRRSGQSTKATRAQATGRDPLAKAAPERIVDSVPSSVSQDFEVARSSQSLPCAQKRNSQATYDENTSSSFVSDSWRDVVVSADDSNVRPNTWYPPESSPMDMLDLSVRTTVSDDGTIVLPSQSSKRTASSAVHSQRPQKKPRGNTRSDASIGNPSSLQVSNVVPHLSV